MAHSIILKQQLVFVAAMLLILQTIDKSRMGLFSVNYSCFWSVSIYIFFQLWFQILQCLFSTVELEITPLSASYSLVVAEQIVY